MKRFRGYGRVGLAMMVGGLTVGIATNWWPLRVFFTPWMWTGYLLFADALVARLNGTSLLHPRPARFFFMLPVSLTGWLLFEAYNLHLRNWAYIGLPADQGLTLLGYAWSFATIWPALFLTADLAEGLGLRLRGPRLRVGRMLLRTWFVLGLAMAVGPLLLSRPIPSRRSGAPMSSCWNRCCSPTRHRPRCCATRKPATGPAGPAWRWEASSAACSGSRGT